MSQAIDRNYGESSGNVDKVPEDMFFKPITSKAKGEFKDVMRIRKEISVQEAHIRNACIDENEKLDRDETCIYENIRIQEILLASARNLKQPQEIDHCNELIRIQEKHLLEIRAQSDKNFCNEKIRICSEYPIRGNVDLIACIREDLERESQERCEHQCQESEEMKLRKEEESYNASMLEAARIHENRLQNARILANDAIREAETRIIAEFHIHGGSAMVNLVQEALNRIKEVTNQINATLKEEENIICTQDHVVANFILEENRIYTDDSE